MLIFQVSLDDVLLFYPRDGFYALVMSVSKMSAARILYPY